MLLSKPLCARKCKCHCESCWQLLWKASWAVEDTGDSQQVLPGERGGDMVTQSPLPELPHPAALQGGRRGRDSGDCPRPDGEEAVRPLGTLRLGQQAPELAGQGPVADKYHALCVSREEVL